MNSRIISVKTHDSNNRIIDSFLVGNDFHLTIEIEFLNEINNPEIGFAISNMDGCRLHHLISLWDTDFGDVQKGIRSFTAKICGIRLYPGQYTLAIWTRLSHVEGVDDFVERALTINMQESDKFKNVNFDRFVKGGVLTEATWEMR